MNETNPLLDAVEALTKPVRQTRIMETDHDHDWLPLRRNRSKDEMKALKAAGEKRPDKTELTGEWWCPWCDAVEATPQRQVPGTKLIRREDVCLLDQLEAAVGNSAEASGGSQRPSERTPIDVGALQIAMDIRNDLLKWMHEMGARPGGGLSLVQLLTSWHALQQAAPGNDRTGTLGYWAGRIKGLLNPVDRPEITGICPRCEFAFVVTDDSRSRALQGVNGATYDETKVDCMVCGANWTGWHQLNTLANATRRLEGQPELESPPLIA